MNNIISLEDYKKQKAEEELDELSAHVASILKTLKTDDYELEPFFNIGGESLILPSINTTNDVIYALQTILFAMDRLDIPSRHIKPIEGVIETMFKEAGL